MVNVSDQVDRNPDCWAALSETVAAGYLTREDGTIEGRAVSLVVHSFDIATLRGIRLADADHMPYLAAIRQEAAPTAAQVAQLWESALPLVEKFQRHADSLDPDSRRLFDRKSSLREIAAVMIQRGLSPSRDLVVSRAEAMAMIPADLVRARDAGESSDAFYRRIALAYGYLVGADSETPTADLAELAGVPPGTAASWVSRARSRGLIRQPRGNK